MTSGIPADVSDVTADWLSSVTNAAEISEWEVIGEDFGLSGTCLRVQGSSSTGTGIDVVVKVSPAPKSAREQAFYRHCAPSTPIPLPTFHGGEVADERGYLVLSHLAGVTQGDCLKGTDPEGGARLIDIMAALHGRWWGANAPELDHVAFVQAPRKQYSPVDPDVTGRFVVRNPDLEPYLPEIMRISERSVDLEDRLAAGQPTLISNDFHLDNALWDRSGSPIVIDWEGVALAVPEIDVARFFVECLTPAQFEEFGPGLLDRYRHSLRRYGGDPDRIDSGRITAAVESLVLGFVGWLGLEAAPAGRSQRLGRAALASTMAVLAHGDL